MTRHKCPDCRGWFLPLEGEDGGIYVAGKHDDQDGVCLWDVDGKQVEAGKWAEAIGAATARWLRERADREHI